METTTAAIIVLASLLFLSFIMNAFFIFHILSTACEGNDLEDFPKCNCSDANECETLCIAKKNFYDKHP